MALADKLKKQIKENRDGTLEYTAHRVNSASYTTMELIGQGKSKQEIMHIIGHEYWSLTHEHRLIAMEKGFNHYMELVLGKEASHFRFGGGIDGSIDHAKSNPFAKTDNRDASVH